MELRRHTWVNCGRRSLRSSRTNRLLVPRPWNCLPSAAGPSQSPDPPFGTVWRTMCSLLSLSLCRPSVSVWKYFCSGSHSLTLSSESPLNYSPSFSGSESDLITWITLKIMIDWLIWIRIIRIFGILEIWTVQRQTADIRRPQVSFCFAVSNLTSSNCKSIFRLTKNYTCFHEVRYNDVSSFMMKVIYVP